ncbi:MAG: hypothetical protein WAO74_10835 [Polaribacter sp.]|uniref:hypothetical protein n=1 Tax=Polaribacter sp. TaxID=1920175 RepID=UPI003BB0E741
MKSKFLTVFFLMLFLNSFAQEELNDKNEKSKSIENQFDNIYRTSTTYQTYKVIEKDRYLTLKNNVLDSIKNANKLIVEKENLLKAERENLTKLISSLDKTELELEETQKKENSISLFGAHINKTFYNLILWFIIILLISCLLLFIYKFSKSNVDTKKAQDNLLSVESDFETHRKKSLEREQKLRRQLQDEINKTRGNQNKTL